MNYTVGSFVFISSSNANQKYNRIKLCNESVIKINFLTTSFAFFEVSVAWGYGCGRMQTIPYCRVSIVFPQILVKRVLSQHW